MSKAVKSVWISTLLGQIGIVHTINEVGDKKIYIGKCTGYSDEKMDIRNIMENGGKLEIQDVKKMLKHLSDENEDFLETMKLSCRRMIAQIDKINSMIGNHSACHHLMLLKGEVLTALKEIEEKQK